MIEIIVLIFLCKKNVANAAKKGGKPGGFIALTIVLWVAMEILGVFVGSTSDSLGSYFLIVYGMAAMGGFLSYYIAKNYKPSDLPSPSPASREKVPDSRASAENDPEAIEKIDEQAQLQNPTVQPAAKPAPAAPEKAQDAAPFRVTVCNKYTAFGGIYAEGKIEEGCLRVGDAMYA